MSQGDEAVRGVGAGDEQVDAGMVEHFEHAFGAFCCQRVVQRGHKVLQQLRDAVHEGRC